MAAGGYGIKVEPEHRFNKFAYFTCFGGITRFIIQRQINHQKRIFYSPAQIDASNRLKLKEPVNVYGSDELDQKPYPIESIGIQVFPSEGDERKVIALLKCNAIERRISKGLPFPYIDHSETLKFAILDCTIVKFPHQNEIFYAVLGHASHTDGAMSRPIKKVRYLFKITADNKLEVCHQDIPYLMKRGLNQTEGKQQTYKKHNEPGLSEELVSAEAYHRLSNQLNPIAKNRDQIVDPLWLSCHLQSRQYSSMYKEYGLIAEQGGLNLRQFIYEREGNKLGPLTFDIGVENSLRILIEVALCQLAGIRHLDIKPENFVKNLITDAIRLIDFGLSLSERYQLSDWVGTLPYSAPEVRYAKSSFCSDTYSCIPIIGDLLDGDYRSYFHYLLDDSSKHYAERWNSSWEDYGKKPSRVKSKVNDFLLKLSGLPKNKCERDSLQQSYQKAYEKGYKKDRQAPKNLTQHYKTLRPSPIEAVELLFRSLVPEVQDINIWGKCNMLYNAYHQLLDKEMGVKFSDFNSAWSSKFDTLPSKTLKDIITKNPHKISEQLEVLDPKLFTQPLEVNSIAILKSHQEILETFRSDRQLNIFFETEISRLSPRLHELRFTINEQLLACGHVLSSAA